MVRLSILSLYLLLVSGIAFSFGPLEDFSYGLYNLFSVVGSNPSFTPVTSDMSMMTSPTGDNNFSQPLEFVLTTKEGRLIPVSPKSMNLYKHRIPIILFMEQAYDGVDLVEARYAICDQMRKLAKEELQSFSIRNSKVGSADPAFNKEYSCEFS